MAAETLPGDPGAAAVPGSSGTPPATLKQQQDDKRAAQRLLLALSSRATASEELKQVGIAYRAEGSTGSVVKDTLLANFLADKTCRWFHEAVDSHMQSEERSDSSLHGFDEEGE